MKPMQMPNTPAIHPLIGWSAPVRVPEISTPKSPRRQNSAEVKLRASRVRSGVSAARHRMPNRVPRMLAVRAMKMACMPRPRKASGKPSRVVEALAGVPGIPIMMAEREPPETPPTYRPSSRAMARLPWNRKVMPVSSAMPIVVVSPGRAPTTRPMSTPRPITRMNPGVKVEKTSISTFSSDMNYHLYGSMTWASTPKK